jgi:DNA mismatch endonuclease (patch repair protein)
MTDIVDGKTRSRMMAGIRSRDTRPEVALRQALHSRGLRYRLHGAGLPGRPDLVLPRHRVVIFVHGCFWHRHPECRYATTPATREAFWAAKFEANVARDKRVEAELLAMGWRVGIVWECALRGSANTERTADVAAAWIRGDGALLDHGGSARCGIAAGAGQAGTEYKPR